MNSSEITVLIHLAVRGDREAWNVVCERYYPLWYNHFRGEICHDIKRVCDTYDIARSVFGDAFPRTRLPRHEGAFFAWLCAAARWKTVDQRRKKGKANVMPLEDAVERDGVQPATDFATATEQEYERLLDAILSLYGEHQEEMAAIYLKYFEKFSIDAIRESLGTSERTVHRYLERGLGSLREELMDG